MNSALFFMVSKIRILFLVFFIFPSIIKAEEIESAELEILKVCGASEQYVDIDVQAKVVNGRLVELKDYPWTATIARHNSDVSLNSNYHRCGAVLINKNWVLTANHCVYGCNQSNWDKLDVFVSGDTYGSHPSLVKLKGPHAISGIYRPNKPKKFAWKKFMPFMSDKYQIYPIHDLALIRLAHPVLNNALDFGINFATSQQLKEFSTSGSLVKISGFGCDGRGNTIVDNLLGMETRINKSDKCNAVSQMKEAFDPDSMICVGRIEDQQYSCKGDSGSGLVGIINNQNTLFGLVSWSLNRTVESPPLTAYTNISSYSQWIQHTIDAN